MNQMGITQPTSGQGLRSGLEKGGFVWCGNRSGTGQRQKSHGHQEMSSLSRAERQNVSLGHPGQVSEQTLPRTDIPCPPETTPEAGKLGRVSAVLTATGKALPSTLSHSSPPLCSYTFLSFTFVSQS